MSLSPRTLWGCALFAIVLQSPVLWAQGDTEPIDRFRRRGEAARRYDAARGRSRLPDVDLSLERAPEGVEEEEPLFLEGLAKWLRVHGGVGFQEKYTNNVFLQAGGEIRGRSTPDDWIHMVTPSLHLELPSKKMPIKVDYSVDAIRAGHFHGFNTDEHHLSTIADFHLSKSLSLRAANRLERLSVEPRAPGDDVVNYYTNTATASGTYRFGNRASIEGGFQHTLSRFDLTRYHPSEFDSDGIFVNTYYQLKPRLGLITEYEHVWVDNKAFMVDNERDRMAGGLRWDMTPRLTGSTVLGYEWLHLESSRNDGTMYVHSEMVYDYSKRLRFGVYADRTLRETTLVAENVGYGRAFETTQLSLNSIYKFTPKIYGTVGNFVIFDDYSVAPFTVKRFLNASDQDTRARTDNLLGFSLGLHWQPTRYMNFGAVYEHQKNRSNIRRPDFDFEEGVFLLNASLGF